MSRPPPVSAGVIDQPQPRRAPVPCPATFTPRSSTKSWKRAPPEVSWSRRSVAVGADYAVLLDDVVAVALEELLAGRVASTLVSRADTQK